MALDYWQCCRVGVPGACATPVPGTVEELGGCRGAGLTPGSHAHSLQDNLPEWLLLPPSVPSCQAVCGGRAVPGLSTCGAQLEDVRALSSTSSSTEENPGRTAAHARPAAHGRLHWGLLQVGGALLPGTITQRCPGGPLPGGRGAGGC
ncbi:hypothetical protein GDO81_025646 [Engystomops pustulosus]|uniref:Uncharacterized protein n=1 Tax=Engystomops pustulosus TaxID=76066 RepID=A0AAV6YL46_ENGPU|nr:hypothetical protein GDO81_025646 [Engystomops pustulosus]